LNVRLTFKCGLAATGYHTMSTPRPKKDSNFAFCSAGYRGDPRGPGPPQCSCSYPYVRHVRA